MNNTIILVHGISEITEKGDSICGIDNCAEEIKRWDISAKAEAMEELSKHRCTYREMSTFAGKTVVQADEWALQFCECDEDGEYIDGADYELAEEA